MSSETFPASEFDEWAETYDSSVASGKFPFYDYQIVLERTLVLAEVVAGMSVLDLGTGTGNLARLFLDRGCLLWCTDFSERMLEIARRKLPEAHFIQADIRHELPVEKNLLFERIISAYTFHHFEVKEKVNLVDSLARKYLARGGKILIADIAFGDFASEQEMKKRMGDTWEDEFYWIAEESVLALENAGFKGHYTQVSSCEGIFLIEPLSDDA